MESYRGALSGRKFAYLTVVRDLPKSEIEVLCDCGQVKIIKKYNLKGIKSCGCMQRKLSAERNRGRTPHNFQDLSGRRFGKQTVVRFLETRVNGSGERYSVWVAKCDCGKVRECSTGTVKNGFSCGCYCREVSGLSRRLPGDKAALNINLSKYKRSARLRHLDWLLSDVDVQHLMKQMCHYCGVEPRQEIKHAHWSGYRSPVLYNGIDRVDNSKGYEINNVVPCCKICNYAKRDLSQQDFISWAKRIAARCSKDS